ncbi:helix-turn-helix domain-containing protein [Polaromonas hydrogenivorans]|uniref:Helix-turn-helix domain-containing protein n=1 Tax=Polaromonas hydrogenivorans TaxID=335476 RepID=A0AAU7LRB9_9BURK
MQALGFRRKLHAVSVEAVRRLYGRLLLALAEQSTPMTLKDLAAQAGLPASRAHPYLVSFGRLRLIEQDRSPRIWCHFDRLSEAPDAGSKAERFPQYIC